MPNIDQITGNRHAAEPDQTLRRERRVDPGCPQYGVLGMQMVPISKESQIRVGDEITVLEVGEHVYIPQ